MLANSWLPSLLLLCVVCGPVRLQKPPCKPRNRQAEETCGCDEAKLRTSSDSRAGLSGEDSEFYYVDDMVFRKERLVQSDVPDGTWDLNIDFWPGGIIFYIIDESFSSSFTGRIKDAMSIIQSSVGEQYLEFREARKPNGEICRKSYLSVERSEKKQCVSMVGMSRSTPLTQTWLHEDSCSDGTIVHELLHALGRIHEQCRPDRDKHVILYPKNIISSQCNNYIKSSKTARHDSSFRLPYDIKSIMNYESCFFSCNDQYTMLGKDGSYIELNRKEMTVLDIQKMRVLYPANSKVKYSESFCSCCLAGQMSSAAGVILCLALYAIATRCVAW